MAEETTTQGAGEVDGGAMAGIRPSTVVGVTERDNAAVLPDEVKVQLPPWVLVLWPIAVRMIGQAVERAVEQAMWRQVAKAPAAIKARADVNAKDSIEELAQRALDATPEADYASVNVRKSLFRDWVGNAKLMATFRVHFTDGPVRLGHGEGATFEQALTAAQEDFARNRARANASA
jgi:hypothetical protein